MKFRIADTFTDSLAKLTNQEQKAVKTTAFDLQLDPSGNGKQFHRIERCKDPNFWSVRVNEDLRIIVHQLNDNLLLCYVNHHDKAYNWATRRKLERHPKTGAAQIVEIRERVEEITIPQYVVAEEPPELKPLFVDMPAETLLNYGVPQEWLDDVQTATEDTLFDLATHLPHEAVEALLELAVGVTPPQPQSLATDDDPFEHPDAQRRFRVMTNQEELQQALDYPWEKWMVFLHPEQRELVHRDFNGPVRISGSAGTGKTIVALHRAVNLARKRPQTTVLLTTFSHTLAQSLNIKLRQLAGNEPGLCDRVRVSPIHETALELYRLSYAEPELVTAEQLHKIVETAAQAAQQVDNHRFSPQFLYSEWTEVVDAWQLTTWDDYRGVARLGRKTRLGEKQREIVWEICTHINQELSAQNLLTQPQIYQQVTESLSDEHPPFDFVVVDEAQDISVPELKFLAALAGERPNALFFTGDLGQRIFQPPFSWKSLGVDIRGRSHTLKINYRTSHQIRSQADRLLQLELSDVDGNTENRDGTISLFNGPPPDIILCDDEAHEITTVATWLKARISEHFQPHEIGIFVRTEHELRRAKAAAAEAELHWLELDEHVEVKPGHLAIGTMHLAKGLEFRATVVMACDDEVIPLQSRIESVTDDSDLDEVYNTERHLLYVACTRARDRLLLTAITPGSEFLEDLQG